MVDASAILGVVDRHGEAIPDVIDTGWVQDAHASHRWSGYWRRQLLVGGRVAAASVLTFHGPTSRPLWTLLTSYGGRLIGTAEDFCQQSAPPFERATEEMRRALAVVGQAGLMGGGSGD